jgi:hypothetical protein
LASERFLWLAEPFTIDELEAALDLCNNYSPGMDGIKYKIYKALPMRAKKILLGFLMVFFGLAKYRKMLFDEGCPYFEAG